MLAISYSGYMRSSLSRVNLRQRRSGHSYVCSRDPFRDWISLAIWRLLMERNHAFEGLETNTAWATHRHDQPSCCCVGPVTAVLETHDDVLGLLHLHFHHGLHLGGCYVQTAAFFAWRCRNEACTKAPFCRDHTFGVTLKCPTVSSVCGGSLAVNET